MKSGIIPILLFLSLIAVIGTASAATITFDNTTVVNGVLAENQYPITVTVEGDDVSAFTFGYGVQNDSKNLDIECDIDGEPKIVTGGQEDIQTFVVTDFSGVATGGKYSFDVFVTAHETDTLVLKVVEIDNAEGNPVSLSGNELTQLIEIKDLTIAYDANGGEGAPENDTLAAGESIRLAAGSEMTGKIFDHWSTDEEGVNDSYKAGQTVTYEEVLELVPEGEFEVNLFAIYGEGEGDFLTVKYLPGKYEEKDVETGFLPKENAVDAGSDYKVAASRAKADGYVFVKWMNGETAVSPSSTISDIQESVKLVAVWYKLADGFEPNMITLITASSYIGESEFPQEYDIDGNGRFTSSDYLLMSQYAIDHL